MWPLSQKELQGREQENIIDVLFTSGVDGLKPVTLTYEELLNAIVLGGYPEIHKIESILGRSLWFNSYIRDISAFIRFYNIIAPRSCGLVNKSDLASDTNLSEATANNYLSMLEMIYQISLLAPYSSNISKRFI